MKKYSLFLSFMILLTLLLSACKPEPTPTPEILIQTVIVPGTPETVIITATPAPTLEPAPEPKVLRLAYGPGDIPTIDPSLAWDNISIQIIEETTVGLLRQNEITTEWENAMAKDWSISDDGLTYTFSLRDDVPWVRFNGEAVEQIYDCNGNPRMVTAQDFVYGMLRTANPATMADYAYVLGSVVEGLQDYNSGIAPDTSKVGLKALDNFTLEVKVIKPAVYNLNILSLWFAHAMPEWLIDGDACNEGRGDKWIETGFFQGYGPFTVKEWVHGSYLTLVQNPFWPGDNVVPSAKIDEIVIKIKDVGPAFAEFEAGLLDIALLPAIDYDRIHADPELSKLINYKYTLGTEFYAFNTSLAPTDDVRVRRALSSAIDRTALMQEITRYGLVAPYFTHPGATGAPKPADYPDLGISYDPDGAKLLLQDYLSEKGKTAAQLKIVMMYNTSASNKQLAEAMQQMWIDVLGINVELQEQEWTLFRETRVTGKENIYRATWNQEYPDANNFLADVFGASGAYRNIINWPLSEKATQKQIEENKNPAYDKYVDLLQKAAIEVNPQKRAALYAQAEEILVVEEAVIIPLHWYAQEVLMQPEIGFVPSNIGIDHYEKWDIVR